LAYGLPLMWKWLKWTGTPPSRPIVSASSTLARAPGGGENAR
jgi:hypothetical protein